MSKSSPAKYENLTVANATLDAAEDRIEALEAQLKTALEDLGKLATMAVLNDGGAVPESELARYARDVLAALGEQKR